MKILKAIFVNIVLFLLVFAFIEIYIANVTDSMYNFEKYKFSMPKYSSQKYFMVNWRPKDRIIYGKEYNKPPILLLGCSYTYGHGLLRNETFGYKLSQMTKRPVFSFSYIGHGPYQILQYFDSKDSMALLKKPPEYVIYTYMHNHLYRLPKKFQDIDYINKNNIIPFSKYTFWDKFYFMKLIKRQKYFDFIDMDKDIDAKNKKLLLKYEILAMDRKIHEKFPKAKFVILIYSDYYKNIRFESNVLESPSFRLLDSKEFWSEIKSHGIDVFSTKDLLGRTMDKPEELLQNDYASPHPSGYVWDELVPLIVKRIKADSN